MCRDFLVLAHLDGRLPVSPPDIYATLYGRVNNPDWDTLDIPTWQLLYPPNTLPSFAFGNVDPLNRTHHLKAIYRSLAGGKSDGATTRKRAEAALRLMATSNSPQETILEHLPFGLAVPLREAARTSQLSPAGDWPVAAYRLIGREDLAEGMSNPPDPLASREYGSVKNFLVSANWSSVLPCGTEQPTIWHTASEHHSKIYQWSSRVRSTRRQRRGSYGIGC